jgi:hypothetical protein
VLGRRLISGENKQYIIKLFATIRLTQEDNREPRDIDITNNKEVSNNKNNDFEYILSGKQYAYSREHKLAAIDYFQTTWKVLKDRTHERMSNRYAARKLKILRKLLRDWVKNYYKILN